MIEVFKTNVQCEEEATALVKGLFSQFPLIRIDFDLEDCDKVLRVEGNSFARDKIIKMLNSGGYICDVLE